MPGPVTETGEGATEVTTPEVAGLRGPPDTLIGDAEAREESEDAEPNDWKDRCGFGGALFATTAT